MRSWHTGLCSLCPLPWVRPCWDHAHRFCSTVAECRDDRDLRLPGHLCSLFGLLWKRVCQFWAFLFSESCYVHVKFYIWKGCFTRDFPLPEDYSAGDSLLDCASENCHSIPERVQVALRSLLCGLLLAVLVLLLPSSPLEQSFPVISGICSNNPCSFKWGACILVSIPSLPAEGHSLLASRLPPQLPTSVASPQGCLLCGWICMIAGWRWCVLLCHVFMIMTGWYVVL